MALNEPALALSVIGTAGFQVLGLWNSYAPSLSDLRSSSHDDVSVRQKLYDADFLVGGAAVILGVTFAVLTKDNTGLILMLVIFGMVSLWHHAVLNAQPV